MFDFDEIITQDMISEFNQELAKSGAIFRLRMVSKNTVSVQPANGVWLYEGGYGGACIINLSDEFYSYLETFFALKNDNIELHYNTTRTIFWAYLKKR